MKIITISIANRIDRPPGGRGGERETRGAVDKSALIRWRLGSAGGTNESVQKRNASSSNPICARLGWAWRRAARSTANPDPPPPSTTRKIEDRGGWLRPMKRREASRTARQRWIENYCSHGLHANWIIKFSASFRPLPVPLPFVTLLCLRFEGSFRVFCARPPDDFSFLCRVRWLG